MTASEYVYNKVLYYCHTEIFLQIDINIKEYKQTAL